MNQKYNPFDRVWSDKNGYGVVCYQTYNCARTVVTFINGYNINVLDVETATLRKVMESE